MNTDLSNELLDVWSDTEWHIVLNLLLALLVLRRLIEFNRIFLPWNGLDRNLEVVCLDLLVIQFAAFIRCLGDLSKEVKRVSQVCLLDIDAPCCFTETERAELLLVSLIEHIGEERIDRVVLRELLLENEHVVDVREDSVEVRREEMWLNLLTHLGVTSGVELLDLRFSDLRELAFGLRSTIIDVLNVLHL